MPAIATPLSEGLNQDALTSSLLHLIQESDGYRIGLSTCLHKDVAGSLVACASIGELIRLDIEQGNGHPQTEKLLLQLDATLREALQTVRGLTEAQFPPVLKAFGINVALQQHLREMAEQFSGSIILHTDGDEPAFDLPRRLNLFRIVQSLITQCLKHSKSSWIEVTSRAQKSTLEIVISHDGSDELWGSASLLEERSILHARCLTSGVQLTASEAGPRGGSRMVVIASADGTGGSANTEKA